MTFRKSIAAMAVVGCSLAGWTGSLALAPAAGADECASPQECAAWDGTPRLDTILVTAPREPGGGGGSGDSPNGYYVGGNKRPPNPYRNCSFRSREGLIEVEVYDFLNVGYYFAYSPGAQYPSRTRAVSSEVARDVCAGGGTVS